jgi:ketosteroid isomerase-like protein
MTKLPWLISLILCLALPHVSAGESTTDDAFFRDQVASRYVEPFRRGDIQRWIAAFDEEAIALHNRRPPDRGRDAIEAFGSMVHESFELAEYDVEVTDIRRSRDWVYTSGRFSTRFVSRADGSEPFGREQGKFLLLWERQEDESWKIILDMGNSSQ